MKHIKLFEEFIYDLSEAVNLDVEKIMPDKKDIERAEGLSFRGKTFHGSGAPWESSASKMAKLITDKEKLVRRAKAVAARWGTDKHWSASGGVDSYDNVWLPFQDALSRAGFSREQIEIISKHKK